MIAAATPWRPRSSWAEHRRFPAQTVLLSSHATFRRYTVHLLERLGDITTKPELSMKQRARLLHKLGLMFSDWQSAMRSHERYEERRLYPLLTEVFGVELGHLRDHHQELHGYAKRVDIEVERAQQAALAPEADAGWPALERALGNHGDYLNDHLRREESVVVPLVLELSPELFERL